MSTSIDWTEHERIRTLQVMNDPLALLPFLAPLTLLIAAYFARRDDGPRPQVALLLTRAATMVALAIAAFTAGLAALRAPLVSPLLGYDGLGFSICLDGLSATMFAMVAILGAIIVQFSRNYLDGDPRQGVFLADLALTLGCVMALVLAGNLVQLVLGWSATSLALHRLLLFYQDRSGAVIAARKKFIIARLADASLISASLLLIGQFGTGDLSTVLTGAASLANAHQLPLAIHFAAALIGMAAILKAAQFPIHGWLMEMQETPTPVSALLHAGILNGGTFLIVRLAAVVQLSAPVLGALIVVGGFSAIFASVVMVTDSRIKATLAYSSAAHMGFMLLLCGIGAYPVAITHLVAHSFYKAHAFLASGSAVDTARAAWVPSKAKQLQLPRILFAYTASTLIVWSMATMMGFQVLVTPTSAGLALIMVLTLSHLMARGASGQASSQLIGKIALTAAATALSFYVLENIGEALLAPVIPTASVPGTVLLTLITSVIVAFGLVTLLQLLLPKLQQSPWWVGAYVYVRNDLYANSYFDRFIGAHQLQLSRQRLATHALETTPIIEQMNPLSPEIVQAAIERTTRAVAPLWPLKTFVAVNPFMGLANNTIYEAIHTMARTTGARLTMSRRFYADALALGRLEPAHLDAALAEARARGESGLPADGASLVKMLHDVEETPLPVLIPTVADAVSAVTGCDWNKILVERIGAWAATYFDEGQASWRSPWRHLSPYQAFRAEASLDATPEIFGARRFRSIIQQLPSNATDAAVQALNRLGAPKSALDLYLQRLLASIGGWAAYARQKVWQSELYGANDETLAELLAIRLAWEVALLEAFAPVGAEEAWRAARTTMVDDHNDYNPQLAIDLILQTAYEKAWQEQLLSKLARSPQESPNRPSEPPAVQAAFCIDVRSELFRRALEQVDGSCETIGFAGFFGFPVEYVPIGHEQGGSQCPVLLTPQGVVVESVVDGTADETARVAEARLLARRARNAWKSFKTSAIACFGFVGPVGLAYLPKLISDGLGLTRTVPHPGRDGVRSGTLLGPNLTPQLQHGRKIGLTHEQRLAMAEGLLRGMSLTSGFARLVMLTGHGSTTVNNPHAAGLDCGACGGHTGEANARIGAMVLNEPSVRQALGSKGIAIPEDTHFLGCLHDTTTDMVTIFDRHLIPASHAQDLEQLETSLVAAGVLARRMRAPLLGEKTVGSKSERRILARSRDWAQVRPEWGLAGCASFIVAPRQRTIDIDLGGRAFLHSYDWQEDELAGFPVLELVMTAPMVVGSWISLQYYASTVDNRIYGCGNKVLHNVVGTIGVLEGNGGDLRVGLPWQSIHDGERLVHEPLRLNVLIEAPLEAINTILAKHASVRALVDNGWLHLYAFDKVGTVAHKYSGDLTWGPVMQTKAELAA